MRYTPIIDISEYKTLYQNINVRLVYLHLVLKSGYYDYNRDMISISLRQLSTEVGITLGAVRHALEILTKAKMIYKKDNVYHVRKWIVEQKITSRATSKRQEQAIQTQQDRDKANKLREAEYQERQKKVDELRRQGKTSYMVYYESMMKKAEMGDLDALKIVERNKTIYEEHKARMESENSKK